MDEFEGQRQAFLSAARRTLATLDVALDELPYTPQFEELFARFIAIHEATIDRHDFWKLLVDAELGEVVKPVTEAYPVSDNRRVASSPPLNRKFASQIPAADAPASSEGMLFPMQPWSLKAEVPIMDGFEEDRKKLLAALDRSEFATIDQRVGFILLHYPETRDSGIALALRYWAKFQADILERWDRQDLGVLFELEHLESITRSMRHVQNTLRLLCLNPHRFARIMRL